MITTCTQLLFPSVELLLKNANVSADFVILDSELPQMGTKQWADTYGSKLTAETSPTMVDMIGSVRSKIFSIVKIIERDSDRYEVANKHYKILLDALPTKDRVSSTSSTEENTGEMIRQ